MFHLYLKSRCGIPLRDFRTADGESILQEVADDWDLSTTTLQHVKAFLSGAFRHAKRKGVINTENPMRDVVLPKGRPAGETHAYSLEEELRMLKVLPEPAATVVATAAFFGGRKGEFRALRWQNYDGQQLWVKQSAWRSHVLDAKTSASKAPVPVIPQLRERLDLHRALNGNPRAGYIFANAQGKPLNLDALAADQIRPALKKAGLPWYGWHAFRRGLGTNLHHLGVPDKTIQTILRHSNVSVTQKCYIKTVSKDAVAAMEKLQRATTVQPQDPDHIEKLRRRPM